MSSPVPANAHSGGYQSAPNGNGANGYGQPAPISPPSAPLTPPPVRHEPEPDWASAAERQPEREEAPLPPRVVELPDSGRPTRPARPVVLEDDDLDVPDFLK